MTIKYHYEYTRDWLINRPSAKEYYDDVLVYACRAFINAGTNWQYSDNGQLDYVTSTTAAANQCIRTAEVYNTVSNYYIRFWFIAQYNDYFIDGAAYNTYTNISSSELSNVSSIGTTNSMFNFHEDNLYSIASDGAYPKLIPSILFCAVDNKTIGKDFGSKLNTLTCIQPLDQTAALSSRGYCYNSNTYAGGATITRFPSQSIEVSAGAYGKLFWTITDDSGNYTVFGVNHYHSERKYDTIICFGNILSNFNDNDIDQFAFIAGYDSRGTSNPNASTANQSKNSIFDYKGCTPSYSARVLSLTNYIVSSNSMGHVPFKGNHTNKTSLILSNPLQPKFGNVLNYTPFRVALSDYDNESQLVANYQPNKGIINTDYVRYIGTSVPGTDVNLWRTFGNKQWIMLKAGWLFRWDPTAPDMRNF